MTEEERKLQQMIAKEKGIPTKYITVRGQDWSRDPEWAKIKKKRYDDKVKDLPEGAKIKPIMGPTPTGLKPSQIWTGSTDYCNVCKTHPCKCES